MDNHRSVWLMVAWLFALPTLAVGQGARPSYPLYERGVSNYHEGVLFSTNATGKILVRTADEPLEAVNYQQLTNLISGGVGSGNIHSLSNNVFNPVGFTNRFHHTVVVDNLVETGGVMRVSATNNSYGVVLRFEHFTNNIVAWREVAPSTNWVVQYVASNSLAPAIYVGGNTGLFHDAAWRFNPSNAVLQADINSRLSATVTNAGITGISNGVAVAAGIVTNFAALTVGGGGMTIQDIGRIGGVSNVFGAASLLASHSLVRLTPTNGIVWPTRIIITNTVGGDFVWQSEAWRPVPNYTWTLAVTSNTIAPVTYDYWTTNTVAEMTTNRWNMPFGAFAGHLADVVAVNRLATFGYTTNTPTAAGFSGSGMFAVLLQDGRVFCPSFSSPAPRLYDPVANTVASAGGTWGHGVAAVALMTNGWVCWVPTSASALRLYDPVANTNIISAATTDGVDRYLSAVTMSDGRVFLVPYNAAQFAIYDPATDSLQRFSTNTTTTAAYSSGALLPSGRVFMVPGNATTAAIYDPTTHTVRSVSNTVFTSGGGYSGSVVLFDGRVFLVPSGAVPARIYDETTDSYYTVPGGNWPGSNAYRGGFLLPDGRVFCVPYNATTARIYDPFTDAVTTQGTYPGASAFWGGVLLPDGRGFLAPSNTTTGQVVGVAAPRNFNEGVLRSPTLNRY